MSSAGSRGCDWHRFSMLDIKPLSIRTYAPHSFPMYYPCSADTCVDTGEPLFGSAEFLGGPSVSSSQNATKRFESGDSFFKEAPAMLSNLYRLSRSLRSFDCSHFIICETLPHTVSRSALWYSKRTSISVSSTGIERFSTLKESEQHQKYRKPTYSKSRILYSSFAGIKMITVGPKFS